MLTRLLAGLTVMSVSDYEGFYDSSELFLPMRGGLLGKQNVPRFQTGFH
jgi:hypothetical protein